MEFRLEKDLLGSLQIPAHAYWGIHTQRAIENFSFSTTRVNPALIKALALVKKSCLLANNELGFIDHTMAQAIIQACEEISDGKFADQFVLDALQAGAGTSTNMNVNEVIANRALEILGYEKGRYDVLDPIEIVNKHQSTNDVYPTAVRVGIIFGLRRLSQIIASLQGAFQLKEKEFSSIVTIGRTEMQEAVPITLGAEFGALGEMFSRDRWRIFKSEERLRVVNCGATAVGTGLGAPRDYIFLVIEKLRQETGIGLCRGENLMDATANWDSIVEVSGMLKAHAVNLIKAANDLRLLSLLGEVSFAKLQAGSSIMAGKVNPVMLEAVVQIGLKVIANDSLITHASCSGTLQINEFAPLIAHAFFESLDILENIDKKFTQHVNSIQANPQVCNEFVSKSTMIITAFIPHIGYNRCTELILEFKNSQRTDFKQFLSEKLGADEVERVLSPENITALGHRNERKNS